MAVPSADTPVTFEDQQCINRFATLNANYKDIKHELDNKKSYMKALDDATETVEEIMLLDEDSKVSYQLGEVFFDLSPAQVQERIEKDKEECKKRIAELEKTGKEQTTSISELKVKLYAKFGQKINLEEDGGDD